MIRYLRPLSYLLPLLIIQACVATKPPQKAKPYHPPSTHKTSTQKTTVPPVVPTTITPTKNPTVQNIQAQATQLKNKGQLESAAQTLERGLRIAPKNASLWSQLADVRLQQQQYGQAQSMAQKSNNLAGANASLIQKNQSIIMKAQKQQR